MPADIAFLIVAIAVIAITYKTYVGYGNYGWGIKLSFLLFLLVGWSAPFIGFAVRRLELSGVLIHLTDVLYFLFGYVFFLFIVSFIRDTGWMIVDLIRRVPINEMKNPLLLQKVNLYTLAFALLFCLYGVFEATKIPTVKTYDISSPKIKKNTKLVMLSDLHIDVDTSPKTIEKIVNRVKKLQPDMVVIVGDTVDNTPARLYNQMQELKKLEENGPVYIVLGNHEFYAGAREWAMGFSGLYFRFLNNYGEKVGDTGIYLAGIPDINAAQRINMPIKTENALYKAEKDDFVILLSHTPKIAEGLTAENVDLQLSGHTHGGQIYPFHYFVEAANDGVLAGFYNKNGIKMYVSRGTRYWGPPMRIFAPAEITLFNLMAAPQIAKETAQTAVADKVEDSRTVQGEVADSVPSDQKKEIINNEHIAE